MDGWVREENRPPGLSIVEDHHIVDVSAVLVLLVGSLQEVNLALQVLTQQLIRLQWCGGVGGVVVLRGCFCW